MPNMASLSLWRTPNLYQTMKTTTLPITRTKHFLYRQIRCHFQSRNSSGFRRQTQYTRFTRAQSIKYQWQESPGFRYGVGALSIAGVGFVVVNTEIVPVSGRRRFNWVSPAKEEQLGSEQFQQVLQEFGGQILPAWHPNARMVQRVLDRLIPASGLADQAWEVYVIDDPMQINAFVIPGGKVFVFSGLLPICAGEDGLATVLGHEIAHNVAHHSAEKYSTLSLLIPIAWIASYLVNISGDITYTVLDYSFQKPGSRKQESEADYIGLMIMARSCYDPEASVGLWQRMEQAQQVTIPQFLSTHPSNHNRIEKIQEWLPEARQISAESGCASTLQYADQFKKHQESFW